MAVSEAALDVVSSARLSPIEHQLLRHFVQDAFDSELASKYLLSRLNSHLDAESSLRNFKHDWRKLVARLASLDPVPQRLANFVRARDHPNHWPKNQLLGHGPKLDVEAAYIIPPSMLRGVELVGEGRLLDILDAFLSPDHLAELRPLLLDNDGNDRSALQNIWLLPPSIHKAFREGHEHVKSTAERLREIGEPSESCENTIHRAYYSLRALYPEPPRDLFFADGSEWESSIHPFQMTTADPRSLSLPSDFLFRVHYRFATALHLFYVEDVFAQGWPQPRPSNVTFFKRHMRRAFHFFWLYLPLSVRLRCYFFLTQVGRRLYGPGTPWVHPVPFGLIFKECIRSGPNEANALKLVKQCTSIPAPSVVDAGEYRGKTYLVMTRIPGEALSSVFHLMSYAERDRLVNDLKDSVAQLRTIPNLTPHLICDTLGRAVVDHRVPDQFAGPFDSEADFTRYPCMGEDPAEVLGDIPVPQGHRSYFTHSDFHGSNLLMENGRLSGIIDWECAGYKPEYWESVKAIACFDGGDRGALFRGVFGHQYEQELAAESFLRRFAPLGCL